jgi:hypothetical protein
MPKFHPAMSKVVLDRKQKRRDKKIALWSLIGLFVPTIIFLGIVAVQTQISIHQAKVKIAQKQALIDLEKAPIPIISTTPDWADFKISGTEHETSTFLNPDGVPEEVMIDGEKWDIIHVDHFDEAEKYKPGQRFGGDQAETYCAERTIAYVSNEDKTELRVDLMHEIFHAGACGHGGDTWWNSIHPTSTYHPGIYHLGEFMATFLRDNPQFAMWEAE